MYGPTCTDKIADEMMHEMSKVGPLKKALTGVYMMGKFWSPWVYCPNENSWQGCGGLWQNPLGKLLKRRLNLTLNKV